MTGAQIEAWIAGFRVTTSMQQISTQTGLSRAHLYRLAAGDIRRPSYETVERLQRLTRQVQPAAATTGALLKPRG